MKFFEDILQSISGNAKTKVNDPFIGAFIGSWILCNWSQLANLIWGVENVSERIKNFENHLNSFDLFSLNPVLSTPLLLAFFFVIVFPWISLILKKLQKNANQHLHRQAIDSEIDKTKLQEALNKQRLLANPAKKFLEQNVQLDILRREELLKQLKLRTNKRKDDAEAASAKANELKSTAKIAKLKEDKEMQNLAIEKQRFNLSITKIHSAAASNRFPSAYSFMLAIQNSLDEDGVQLSITGLGEVVAAVFGYESFSALLADSDFNNVKLDDVAYIYYNSKILANNLEKIVEEEKYKSDDLSPELLFDHVISTFSDFDQKLIEEGLFEEIARDIAQDSYYEILNGEGLSGLIAESDTIYEDISIEDLESQAFNKGINLVFSGVASGSHRKENDVPGRDIHFTIEIKNTVLLGSNALSEFEVGVIEGQFEEYYSDDIL